MQYTFRTRIGVAAAGSLAIAALGGTAVAAEPTPGHGVVKDGTTWTTNAFNADGTGSLTPQQGNVAGPARAPFGAGSHQITIGGSDEQAEIYRTADFDGEKLADVTRLEFSTYAHATSGDALRQPTALRIALDTDDDDVRDTKLYFFPANNGDQQEVANDVWQSWTATQTTGKFSVDGDGGPQATTTLAAFVAEHPDATLVHEGFTHASQGGALGLLTGGSEGGDTDPQVNGTYNVDRVIVGVDGADTLYDLGKNDVTIGAVVDDTLTAGDLAGWTLQAYDWVNGPALTPSATFVSGPKTPTAGVGSLRFSISDDTNPNRVERLRSDALDGRLVRDLHTLDFSTFQTADAGNGVAQMPVYVRINVDTDGDLDTDERLYYYPSNNGGIAQDEWQTWHAAQGKWNINGGDDGPANAVTLDEYAILHPDARFVANPADGKGGFAFQVGGGGAAQTNGSYFLDDVTLATVDAATGATATGTAYDLEPSAPVVSVADATVTEGNEGATTITFPVTLDAATSDDVTVHFATSRGTARAKDFTATSGDVTIPAGETTASVEVPVLTDKVREKTETFGLALSDARGAALGTATATGTIADDDTRVDLVAQSPKRGKVKVTVATVDPASKATVKVYVGSAKKPVLTGDLNRAGRLATVLDREFDQHAKVAVYARVVTDHGTYTSRTVQVRVR